MCRFQLRISQSCRASTCSTSTRHLENWNQGGNFAGTGENIDNEWQAGDQVSWNHGKHTVRFGFEWEFDQYNNKTPASGRGDGRGPGGCGSAWSGPAGSAIPDDPPRSGPRYAHRTQRGLPPQAWLYPSLRKSMYHLTWWSVACLPGINVPCLPRSRREH